MADRIEQISDDFYSIRGSFKIGGLLDIGTHAALVRKADGRFVMLDSYTLKDDVEAQVAALTEDGALLDAILNLHPFHTVHCKRVHAQFPNAKLYGTVRHAKKAPDLPWQTLTTDDPALHASFAEDFEFSVPAGVDFISDNENIHFSSVLARHRASRTVHVDDTLSYAQLPGVVRMFGWNDVFAFHPTLGTALLRKAGAAAAFRTWAQDIATRWRDTTTMATAHLGIWQAPAEGAFEERVLNALNGVESTLAGHARKHG
ncbi:MAG: hypothetical protein AAGA48_30990 [Myxococcota bacterium]